MDVHLFSFRGRYLAYDVNSGSLLALDQPAASVIGHLKEKLKEREGVEVGRVIEELQEGMTAEEAEACQEIKELVQEGILFSPAAITNDYTIPSYPLKALCLNIAHACNLSCEYCFAGQGRYGGGTELMSIDTALRAVDFLFEVSGKTRHIEIDFFGGEPLLNPGVIVKVVEYGRRKAAAAGKKIKFTLTSNAYEVSDEIINFINEAGISLVLSLDGRPAVHNRTRKTRDGKHTYARVAANIDKWLQRRNYQDYYVRATYTAYNLDFSQDASHIIEQGWLNFSLEPVVASVEEDYAIKPEHIDRICREYEMLLEKMLCWKQQGKKVNFYHFQVDLQGGPCLLKRLTGCGAGYQYLAVAAGGELYPCHQFVGNHQFCLGNVYQGIKKSYLSALFRGVHILRKEKCRKCWARYLCGGGCHAHNFYATGKLEDVPAWYCKLVQKRLECALIWQACCISSFMAQVLTN